MENYQIGLLGFVALLCLIALRVPIAFALSTVGLAGMLTLGGQQATFAQTATKLYSSVANHTLTAVPLFLLMGYFAEYAGLTTAAFDVARLWFSRLPGGLAVASVGACAVFGAASGSSVASAGAMGKIAVPQMLRCGYDRRLACGTIAAAATLDVLIPPSIVMVVYAIITETSIGRLLLAGYLPGILSAIMLGTMIYIRVKREPALAPAVPFTVTWGERVASLKEVWGITLLIILVMGGIYVGFVTATEAAALGAFGALVLMFTARELTWPNFRDAVFEMSRTTGMIFLLIICASIFTGFIAISGLPQKLAALIIEWRLPVLTVILVTCVVYIFLGMFLDSISMMLLTLPVLLPILSQFQVDLIWFGIIVVKLVEIGCLTPPFGITVYVVKGVVGDLVPLEDIFRGIWWFLMVELIALTILLLFPQISLIVPNTMLGTG
jgi:C4-dicarboxylate transporter, DctM subunit